MAKPVKAWIGYYSNNSWSPPHWTEGKAAIMRYLSDGSGMYAASEHGAEQGCTWARLADGTEVTAVWHEGYIRPTWYIDGCVTTKAAVRQALHGRIGVDEDI